MEKKSGKKPTDITNNPARVLGEYWYANLGKATDLLDGAVAVNGCSTTAEEPDGVSALRFRMLL